MESDTGTDKTAGCRGANRLHSHLYLPLPYSKNRKKNPPAPGNAGVTGPVSPQITVKPVKNKSNQYTDDILKSPFLVTAYLWGQPNQQEKTKNIPCENLRPRKAGPAPPPKGRGF